METRDKVAIGVLIIIGLLVIIVFAYTIILMAEDSRERFKFYKEWCPKLNATLVEPIEGYYYHAKCFRESNGEVKYYYINEVNGKHLLLEDQLNYG